MRARSKRKMVMTMGVMVVVVVVGYTCLSLSPSTEYTHTLPGRGSPSNPEEEKEEERRIIKEEEEKKNEKEGEGEEGRGPPPEEEALKNEMKIEMKTEPKKTMEEMEKEKKMEEEKKKQQEEERKREEEEGGRGPRPDEERKKQEEEKKKKEEEKKARGGGGRRKIIRKDFWVDEMEELSPSTVNMEEMEEEMRRRRRRVEERCGEILTDEERNKEINSMEFLISKKYKLVWCNNFKVASSTWMYNFLRMAGKAHGQLENLRESPVEAARHLYPRPSPEELRGYLGKSLTGAGDAGTGDAGVGEGGHEYLSFIIVRDPFQRLLSAFRDKLEKDAAVYRSLRCEITDKYGKDNVKGLIGARKSCSPTFSQFVDYVLDVEGSGGLHNEHWMPYYRFCTPCSTHFDLILRFETLDQDEAYLLQKVPGLSDVVSPKKMHSSHSNYTSILAGYYTQLSAGQMLGLVKIYLPDFWLFGYNERPYLDMVL